MLKAGKVHIRLEVLALKYAGADKSAQSKEVPNGPKLDPLIATKEDEKQAAQAKGG